MNEFHVSCMNETKRAIIVYTFFRARARKQLFVLSLFEKQKRTARQKCAERTKMDWIYLFPRVSRKTSFWINHETNEAGCTFVSKASSAIAPRLVTVVKRMAVQNNTQAGGEADGCIWTSKWSIRICMNKSLSGQWIGWQCRSLYIYIHIHIYLN